MVKKSPTSTLTTQVATQVANQVIEAQNQRIKRWTMRHHLRVFKVEAPLTVFVRGTDCYATIRYHDLDQVELHARLYHAFGLQFVTDQDVNGVYIVVKRRPFLGSLSRAEFWLNVPHYTHVALNFTPGGVRLERFHGLAEIPPPQSTPIPPSFDQIR
jgi:hypothetical protein